ncbi:MAG: DUF1801 domain-containing protein [Hyphomicrobiales bacterium]
MRSEAKSVEDYLAELPGDRRAAITAVRKTILENLPEGYVEAMNWGMISYEIPLETCPDTYNGKPLMYAALASQKRHMAVYLCGLYCIAGFKDKFVEAFKASGKKLDMGASCVRFKKLEDLDITLVGETIAAVPVDEFIAASRRK